MFLKYYMQVAYKPAYTELRWWLLLKFLISLNKTKFVILKSPNV